MGVLDLDRATLSDFLGVLCGEDIRIREYSRGRIVFDVRQRTAYSYGRHFPLFRQIEAPGPRGRRARYLINGERWGQGGWSSRTNDHQSIVRDFLRGEDTVTLPFGALEGAGIDLDSVRALDVAEETWREVEHEARALEELPLHRRTESYSVELEARELEAVPERHRQTYRAPTELEAEELGGTYARNLPILPGADGLYRWKEHRTRTVSPDADGIYRYTERVHSLGESVFSAVRVTSERREAQPFEGNSETRSRRVELTAHGSAYCGHAAEGEGGAHEAGASGACIHCGDELEAQVTWRRRARYLSGFDTNENPALYFLCELPRGAPSDVEGARLALAPAAVHAAIARGRVVERQGDVFFVDTDLTRAELEARGATFGRLTLWTRGAKPRVGEPGYRAPVPAALARKRARREARRRQEIWRARFQVASWNLTYRTELETRRHEARELRRERWRELEARIARELEAHGPDVLAACSVCAAGIGEPCATIPDTPDIVPARLRGLECGARERRVTLAQAHTGARSTLRAELRRERDTLERTSAGAYCAPASPAGIRKRRRRELEAARTRLEAARAELRSAIFEAPAPVREWSTEHRRYIHRRPTPEEAARQIQRRCETARARYSGPYGALKDYREALYAGARARERDASARAHRQIARELHRTARDSAQLEFRPETVFDTGLWRDQRERVRRQVSIYGTAHTATEVARVRGVVYVRGVVSHLPELERGRGGTRDHRQVRLTPDRWYLAVRNTVPRARGTVDRARRW